ncbi:hypothetical protein A2U01_0008951 [Trifolium medium]|uniref:Uncharacterized protein n=1 Tax=Trifolium medium TaxID=97028 RepID=A0A392MKQ8_9FABA|nr:hypothetical protein [Trifolium medium]
MVSGSLNDIVRVPSRYTTDDKLKGAYKKVGNTFSWRVHSVGHGDMIFTTFNRLCGVPMYEFVLQELGVFFPLTDFEVGVLRHLRLAPSQLHPLAWANLKSFQYWLARRSIFLVVPHNVIVHQHMYVISGANGEDAFPESSEDEVGSKSDDESSSSRGGRALAPSLLTRTLLLRGTLLLSWWRRVKP